jgi:putative membrane protein
VKTKYWIAVRRDGQIYFMNLPNSEETSLPANRHTSDHLANERTFLAWIRTSVSVIGLGFVVAKFSVWLRELSVRIDQTTPPPRQTGLSMPLGVILMLFGGLLALLAAWRYRAVKAAILKSEPAEAEVTMTAVSIVVACIALALIIYMLMSA